MRCSGNCRLIAVFFLLVTMVLAGVADAKPTPQGLWLFNDANNLGAATVGTDLTIQGTVTSVAGVASGDGAVQITPGNFLECYHGAAANGGGQLVNQYAFVFDLQISSLGSAGLPLVQPATDNSVAAMAAFDASGHPVLSTDTDSVYTVSSGSWVRVVVNVQASAGGTVSSFGGNAGAADIFVNGSRVHHLDPSFWNVVMGANDLRRDGPFALQSSSASSPFAVLFQDSTGGSATVACSTVAFYDHALLDAEIASLGDPAQAILLTNVSGATHLSSFGDFSQLAAAHYDTIYIGGLVNTSGSIRLDNVDINPAGTVESMQEGYINFLGQVFTIGNVQATTDGYTFATTFGLPGILGGIQEQMNFDLTSSGLALEGTKIEIPNTELYGAVKLKSAYLEIFPSQGTYGGGGRIQMPGWSDSVGGSITLQSGLGQEILGTRVLDVTEFGIDVADINLPVGEIFQLYEVKAEIQNSLGLSNPVNWGNSALSGSMKFVIPPKIQIGGRSYFPFDIVAGGDIHLADGSFDISGTGTLLNTIDVAQLSLGYDPPYQMTFDGSFNVIEIFTGDLKLSKTASGFGGVLDGVLGIPPQIPVVGGWKLADVQAAFTDTSFTGSADIYITPAIPSVCTPQVCFPQICIYPWYCDSTCWAWIIPYPCNCYVHTACWQPPCIPPICTPAIPAITVHFGFSYSDGQFSWAKQAEEALNYWEIPLHSAVKSAEGGEFVFMTNWYSVEAASTNPVGTRKAFARTKDGDATTTFSLSGTPPAVLFRLNYESGDVTSVDLTVTLPDGTSLDSSDGALPTGYSSHTGYSRFNTDAREQVIVVLDPPAGTYTAAIGDPDTLGNYTIEMAAQDALPTVTLDDIQPGSKDGEYVVSWTDADLEATNHVTLILDHDREGLDGFVVANIDADSNDGTYTLDTTGLQIHGGDYFLAIQVDDGVNAPVHVYSDSTITAIPGDAPAPVSNIQYLPNDGMFHISWDASPSSDVTGYFVLYTDNYEDLSQFDYRYYVPADNPVLGASITGLTNDQPYLVTVVAVDADGNRSLPAEIVRIAPHVVGNSTAPRITSTADPDATATYNYNYLPVFADVDYAASYTWALAGAPAGMEVDASCGLVTWTPTEDQAGQSFTFTLTITEDSAEALSASQDVTIYVYDPSQAQGIEAHNYSVASPAGYNTGSGNGDSTKATAFEGETYEYQILVWGPTEDLSYRLLAGPDGMTVDSTGLVSWDVPAGATGQWVRIEITAEGQHTFYQDFYLHVIRKDHIPAEAQQCDSCNDEPPCDWLACSGGVGPDHPRGPGGYAVALAVCLVFAAAGALVYVWKVSGKGGRSGA